MGRIEKTVFISYRRTNLPWALFIYQNLTMHGYDVFFDYLSIGSGDFERVILENIRAKAHFIVILTPSALERCKEAGDWLRREIETALDEKRNIIPLMVDSFDFGSPSVKAALTGKLANLSKINGLRIPADYALEAMERLRTQFLNVRLSDVVLPALLMEAKEITLTQKDAADQAAPVQKEQLTAQEWFERGYVFYQNKNLEEALRCYHEVIQLEVDPVNLAITYSNLGVLYYDFKRYEEAEAAYRKAIELNPAYVTAYSNFGNLLSDEHFKRYEEAEAAYRRAIELNPAEAPAYSNFGILLKTLERYEEAEAAYRKAIELNPAYAPAYSNFGILLKTLERYEEAEAAYRKAIELNPAEATSYSNFGLLLHEHFKRYEEAEAAYRKAIELNPVLEYPYLYLGELYFDWDKFDDAIKVYSEALSINSDFARCYRMRGLVYQVRGEIETALGDYRRAVELAPDYGVARMSLFGLLMKMGKTAEANEHEELVRTFVKDDDEYNRACFEALCGNEEEALNLLEIALKSGQASQEWACQDPDLESLRNNLRFWTLVGDKFEESTSPGSI